MSLDDLLEDISIDNHEETRTVFSKCPFNYPGAKFRGLKHILPCLPYTNRYVEVFGGSGVVLYNRKPSKLEVYNDRYGGLVDFFRCIRNKDLLNEMIDYLNQTLNSREDFIRFKDEVVTEQNTAIRAAKWFYVQELSFGGLGRSFGRSLTASKNPIWIAIPEIKAMHNRFKNVLIENLDWKQCIKDFAHPDTVFYLDPPYMASTTTCNCYKDSDTFNVDEHKQLCNIVFETDGFFAVSGYENEVYLNFGWDDIIVYDVRISLTSGATKGNNLEHRENIGRGSRREYLYIKYA